MSLSATKKDDIMNNKKLFNLLVFALNSFGHISRVDKSNEEGRSSLYEKDAITVEIDNEGDGCVTLESNRGMQMFIFGEDIERVEVNFCRFSYVKVVTQSFEYVIEGSEN